MPAGAHDEWVSREEHERVVEELRRANRRLSGTLQIVLDTLDSENVATLFSRVLEEITSTMAAEGTVVYLAEPDGYHLRGKSEGLRARHVPRFIAFGRSIETLATRAGGALRLRVLPAEGSELRAGRLTTRMVQDESSKETHRVDAEVLPPFKSFYAVPVWFGGHVVSLIEVGWSRSHPLREEDAELLDAVARYLSVQLVGAFSALRSQKEARLRDAASRIRVQLLEHEELTREAVEEALGRAATELAATAVPMRENPHQNTVMANLPVTGVHSVPSDLVMSAAEGDEPQVLAVNEESDLANWLLELGEPSIGALLDAGQLAGVRLLCLFLRDHDAEPFDDLELAFLSDVAGDLASAARGVEERSADKRISQALQTGMKNELQKVRGISAEGLYSSATAAAFVGGDFYDLIRLPDRRACVIMGDVSGKGVEAASVSAAVRTALAAYSWEGLRPAHMVRLLNDFLLGFSRLETFATLFVGIADLAHGRLTYCSAGHPPALLLRAETGALESLDVQSGVVGAFSDMRYRDGRMRICSGDQLLLYTDGTTEARATDGRFFGEDGLRDAIMRIAPHGFEGTCDRLLAELDAFTDNHLDDDVAIVALRFDEVG